MAENFKIPDVPQGKQRLKWLGPAFIWMLSAAGSGELLFTPRIASQYGYTLIWALLIAVLMKWFINREIGRYTICTGGTFFQGIATLRHYRWIIGFIVGPQLVVAIATIAGLAGAASTALTILIDIPLWSSVCVLTILTGGLVASGGFKTIEKLTTVLAMVISLSLLVAAFSTSPDYQEIGRGLIPSLDNTLRFDEVLPWLGFMLAGAAGLMWFSYWTAARGYGVSARDKGKPSDTSLFSNEQIEKLKGWIRHMTIANTLAVIGALVIAFAFLVLGTELLKPQGLIPGEDKVAETLGKLLGAIWGSFGFWFMILAVFITFMSTMLADQDGFGRMFTDGFSILRAKERSAVQIKKVKRRFVLILLTVIPILAFVIAGDPVALLKLAGIIEAAHIPVVTAAILYLNKKKLRKELQPSNVVFSLTLLSGISFAIFAILYIVQISGLI